MTGAHSAPTVRRMTLNAEPRKRPAITTPTDVREGKKYRWRQKTPDNMVEQFDAKPAEIKALFSNQLEPARTAELRERILAAGLPI